MNLSILETAPQKDYELIDSGDEMKLERYGSFVIARPDPQALWKKSQPESVWKNAHASFESPEGGKGRWFFNKEKEEVPPEWIISLNDMNLVVKLSSFKHTGIFPEQFSNWQWTKDIISKALATGENGGNRKEVMVLNLFGYTGAASVAALQAGAHVTHVDASKGTIEWAKENTKASNVSDKDIRWMLDDARKFVEREKRRGALYHGIIMDPPSFGHGAKKETWMIEKDLLSLLDSCFDILHPQQPLFFILNGYSAGYSSLSYAENLKVLEKNHRGSIEAGELTIRESGPKKRLLPSGIFARWKA